jgi:hypothetical protein
MPARQVAFLALPDIQQILGEIAKDGQYLADVTITHAFSAIYSNI